MSLYDVLKKMRLHERRLGVPTHIVPKPKACSSDEEYKEIMLKFLKYSKGAGSAADLLSSCSTKEEMPEYMVKTLGNITGLVELI